MATRKRAVAGRHPRWPMSDTVEGPTGVVGSRRRLSRRRSTGACLAMLLVAACAATAPSSSNGPASTPTPPSSASSAPTATPTWTGPTGQASATPSGTAPAAPSRLVDHGDRESREVALTFTVGYRLEPAVEILRLLTAREVPATIFMSGIVFDQDETRAEAEEVLRLVASRPDLFQLGQHGYGARELTALPVDDVIAEVRGAEDVMAGYGVAELGPYFSPPGGAWSPELLSVLGRLGYPVSVLWDVDPLDWLPPDEGGPTAEEVAARVLRDVQGGSIVLLHLGGWNTRPALPAIIDGLAERGLRPVTIAELLE